MGSNLFSNYPADKYRDLAMRRGAAGLSEYAMYFREAADRLAASFTGKPFDDTIFMPRLYLHRHATELLLKTAITEAARLRRVEDRDASLTSKRLRSDLPAAEFRPPRCAWSCVSSASLSPAVHQLS